MRFMGAARVHRPIQAGPLEIPRFSGAERVGRASDAPKVRKGPQAVHREKCTLAAYARGVTTYATDLIRQILELTVFLDLDELRDLSKLIHRQLRNHRPQPTRQRTSPRIIREFALFVAVCIDTQPVKLCPDRTREVLGILSIRRDLSSRRFNRRIKIRDQIFPSLLIALFARNDQTQIISPDLLHKIHDHRRRGPRIVSKQILLNRRLDPARDEFLQPRHVQRR